MNTWRDDTPLSVQQDCDALFAEAAAVVKKTKRSMDRLIPFALTKPIDNKRDFFIGALDKPLEALNEVLQARADAIDAAITVTEATLKTGDGREQAIAFYLEHRSGLALTILLPYRNKLGIFRRVTFGDPTTKSSEPPYAPPFRLW
jgi:hypothetical protein